MTSRAIEVEHYCSLKKIATGAIAHRSKKRCITLPCSWSSFPRLGTGKATFLAEPTEIGKGKTFFKLRVPLLEKHGHSQNTFDIRLNKLERSYCGRARGKPNASLHVLNACF